MGSHGAPKLHAPNSCSPVHKVAGAVDGVDDPGRAVGEHTLGPGGCGLFCNEPAGAGGAQPESSPTLSRRAYVAGHKALGSSPSTKTPPKPD